MAEDETVALSTLVSDLAAGDAAGGPTAALLPTAQSALARY